MLQEFRRFITRGNVMDLAVAVIIGAAFGAIINAVVQDLITPLLGLLGDRNFSDFYLTLKGEVPANTPYENAKAMGVVLGYGAFITALINFLLIAAVVFGIVRAAERLKARREQPTEKPKEDTKSEMLLAEIRDLLKERKIL